MYAARRFAVRHARFFERLYNRFEALMVALDPLFARLGYDRLERPVAFIERAIKGFLFDCKMCGQCVLSSTGMACPMNCPKNLRNGPCGGVREDGSCEVRPEMRCVWLEAWEGAARMPRGLERIAIVQPPVDRALAGSSSWLRVAREKAAERRRAMAPPEPTAVSPPERARSTLAKAFRRARRLAPSAAPLAAEPEAALADQAVEETTSVFESPTRQPPHQESGEGRGGENGGGEDRRAKHRGASAP